MNNKLNISLPGRLMLIFTGIGLTALSALCTAFFLFGLAPDSFPGSKEGAFFAGIFLELGKFYLIPLSIVMLTIPSRRVAGSALFLVGAVLFVVSVMSSVFFMQQGTEVKKNDISAQNSEYVQLIASIKSIDDQIGILDLDIEQNRENAKRFTELGYVSRSNETVEKGQKLNARRMELVNTKNALSDKLSQPVIDESYLYDSKLTSVFWIVAVLIDLVAICCLTIIQIDSREKEAGNQVKKIMASHTKAPRVTKKEDVKPEANVFDDDSSDELIDQGTFGPLSFDQVDSALYQTVVEKLVSGEITPRTRDIRNLIGKRNVVASQYLAKAEYDGIIKRQGRAWLLAS